MFGTIGVWEMVVILLIALLIFGPRKLPEMGKSLGRSLAEFKRASNELRNTLEEEVRVEEQRERVERVKTTAESPAAPTDPVPADSQAGSPTPASPTTSDAPPPTNPPDLTSASVASPEAAKTTH